MKQFFTEIFKPLNAIKALGGAAFMVLAIFWENRENPINAYAFAAAGQLVYSFLSGQIWMALYQTSKKTWIRSIPFRGLLSAFLTAGIVFFVTLLVHIMLSNPEALATAWWAFGLSAFAFLGNEILVRVDPERDH